MASERREQDEGGLRVMSLGLRAMSERENELGLAKVKEINVREIFGESGKCEKSVGNVKIKVKNK